MPGWFSTSVWLLLVLQQSVNTSTEHIYYCIPCNQPEFWELHMQGMEPRDWYHNVPKSYRHRWINHTSYLYSFFFNKFFSVVEQRVFYYNLWPHKKITWHTSIFLLPVWQLYASVFNPSTSFLFYVEGLSCYFPGTSKVPNDLFCSSDVESKAEITKWYLDIHVGMLLMEQGCVKLSWDCVLLWVVSSVEILVAIQSQWNRTSLWNHSILNVRAARWYSLRHLTPCFLGSEGFVACGDYTLLQGQVNYVNTCVSCSGHDSVWSLALYLVL